MELFVYVYEHNGKVYYYSIDYESFLSVLVEDIEWAYIFTHNQVIKMDLGNVNVTGSSFYDAAGNMITLESPFKLRYLKHILPLSERLHDSMHIKSQIEEKIMGWFEEYEPEISNVPDFDFSVGSDSYDNSIEIHFNVSLPYPYEPCKKIREKIRGLGFSKVMWRFLKDTYGDSCDEIRDYEPRHTRDNKLWFYSVYGLVDDRFEKQFWEENYG